jgi:hypothetical protein
MRKSLYTVGSLLALLLTVAGSSATEDGRRETCQEELNNNVYLCQVKSDFGTTFEDCFRFTSPDVASEDFDLLIDGFGDLACECKAEGSFRRPKFEQSFEQPDEFHCVAVPETNFFNLAVEGEVEDDGDELEDGQAVNSFGNSFVLKCKRDSTCSVPTARSASPWGRQ